MREWPIAGHTWATQQLRLALERGEVPHALLITGPESVGKTTLARTLVTAMLCRTPDPDDRPCGQCNSCRKANSGNHPDFVTIEPDDKGAALRIEQIRSVERFLSLTPNESTCKVVLIREFEHATAAAANALLKTLEEPPSYAHLILLAADPDVLLPTIVSRSQQIALRPLSRREVEGALIDRGVPVDRAAHLARLSGGRIGWAIQAALDEAAQEPLEQALTTLFELLRQDLPTRFERAYALSREATRLADMFEYWLTAWRDVLLLQTESEAHGVYHQHRATLSQWARDLDLPQTLAALKALEEAHEALQANANTQLMLENLFLALPQF